MSRRANLSRPIREQSIAIYAVLRPAGLQAHLVRNGKHMKVQIVDLGGGIHKMPLSSSPTNLGDTVDAVGREARHLLQRLRKRGLA